MSSSALLIEPLEPRVLLSADPSAGALAARSAAAAEAAILAEAVVKPAPSLSLALARDTGTVRDGLTSDATVTGTAKASVGIAKLVGGFKTLSPKAYVDVTAGLKADGSFQFSAALLQKLNGGKPLADGAQTLTLTVTDKKGATLTRTLTFTLDRIKPSLDLALARDTGTAGDKVTSDATLVGSAKDARGIVRLVGGFETVKAGAYADVTAALTSKGTFELKSALLQKLNGGKPLADGRHTLTLVATDRAGNAQTRSYAFVLDTSKPVLKLVLTQDTGASASDRLTSNPALTGTVPNASGVAALQVAVDGGTTPRYVSVLSSLRSGAFSLSAAQVRAIAGGTLADGVHTATVVATDKAGRKTTARLTFTLKTTTTVPVFNLSANTDTGLVNDFKTTARTVTFTGKAEAGATVTLVGLNRTVKADAKGVFTFTKIALPAKTTAFTARSVGVSGAAQSFTVLITRAETTTAGELVLGWNQLALEAVKSNGFAPPLATRALAMQSLAVYDALNAVAGSPGYLVAMSARAGTSAEAAVAAAAYTTLRYLFPKERARLDAQYAASLKLVKGGAGKEAGIALGKAVAEKVIALRVNDGSEDFVVDEGGTAPGRWRPTGPTYDSGLLPQWVSLDPFVLKAGNQFRPSGPAKLTGKDYAAAFNEVKSLGAVDSTKRSAEQTQIARFWADGSGTYTPPGHWNQIAADLASNRNLGLADTARLMAMLNLGMADTSVAAWDAKYAHDFWRPETAIANAASDGNAATAADPKWRPLLLTPPFPEYVSGHSTYSAAAATILGSVFGEKTAFQIASPGLPGVVRSFASFTQAAEEAGRSRIYGGIHFQFSNKDGLATGQKVGAYVVQSFSAKTEAQGPRVALTLPKTGTVTNKATAITGQVLDLSGVRSLSVSIDGAKAKAVAFDKLGSFSLSLAGLKDGLHRFAFTATDKKGNVSPARTVTVHLDRTAPQVSLTSLSKDTLLTAASRLTGSVTSGGSNGAPLAALSYRFDKGPSFSVSFDARTGAFDTALDLTKLSVGSHTLSISATDRAGNASTLTLSLRLADAIPLTVRSLTPAAGAGDVGVTFRPEVTFSRPVDTKTLTADSFYATDAAGKKIAATIVPYADATGAFLLFAAALPSAASVTLHLEGAAIKGADGKALDADGDGAAGGTLTRTFTTVSTTGVVGTSITGIVVDPGTDLKPMTFDDIRAGADGALHTGDDVFLNPIANAKVFILGRENTFVYTDAAGRFTLTDIPAGNIKLAVDGRTAKNAPDGVFFPEMVLDLTVRPGVANTAMGSMGTTAEQIANADRGEIYLPRIATATLQTVDKTKTTTVTLPATAAPDLTDAERAQMKLVIQPGSLIGEDGKPVQNGKIGLSTVPAELVRDMLPPGVMQHTFDITIQAPGTAVLTTPAQLTMPNVFNLKPGEKTYLLSFDHTTGRLVIDGTMTVSADGKSVTTDPGQGVTKPGWHGMTPPGGRATGNPNDLQDIDLNDIEPANGLDLDLNGDGLPDIIQKKRGVDTNNLDNRLRDIFPDIADAFNNVFDDRYFQPLISSGNDSTHGDGSAHYDDRAIDLSRRNGDNLNDLMSLDETKRIVEELTGSEGRNTPTPRDPGRLQYDWDRNGDGVRDYTVLIEHPGEDNQHIHIQVPPASVNLKFVSAKISSNSENTTSVSVKDVKAKPSGGPYFGLIVYSDGQEERFRTDASGNYDIFVRSDSAGVISFWDPISNLKLEQVFHSGPSGVDVDLLNGKSSLYNALMAEGLNPDEISTIKDPYADYAIEYGGGATWRYGFVKDQDGDGLRNDIEYIIGTDPKKFSTGGNGVSDYSAIKIGADPFGGRAVTTGIQSSISLNGEAHSIVLYGSVSKSGGQVAYIATGSFGLAIVDATVPLKPILTSQLDLDGQATDVDVDTVLSRAAVAIGSGLAIVDVSTPTAPKLVQTVAVKATQVEVFEGIAYASDGANLTAIDLSTGDILQTLALGSGAVTGIAREGTTLYTTDATGTLSVVDLAAGLMQRKGSLTNAAGREGKLTVADGIAYLGASDGFQGGFATVDVRDPAAPKLISEPDATNLAGTAIAVNGSGLGVVVGSPGRGGTNALDLVNTADPSKTDAFITRITLPGTPNGVAIGGGIAFVATGAAGLQVVNYRAFDTAGKAPTLTVTEGLIDIDASKAGLQVQEGQTIRLKAKVGDDVQVRSVEVLINGRAVTNDISAPFDLSALLPTIKANGSNAITVQLRATDTGGNVTLSPVVDAQLVPDTVAPALVAQNVTEGAIKGSSFRALTFTFSEALDPASVTADTFRLVGPNGRALTPTALQLRDGGRTVQVTYDPLTATGAYQVVVDKAVTDRAGNALGLTIATSFTVATYSKQWVGTSGGAWNDGANWSDGKIPGADDDVFIGLGPDQTITIEDTVKVASLNTQAGLVVTGSGELTIEGAASLGSLTVEDYSAFAANGTTTIGRLAVGYATFTGKGDVTITGSAILNSSTMIGTGRTIVAKDATISVGSNFYNALVLSRELDIAGRLDLGANQTIALGSYDSATQSYIAGKLVVTAEGRVTMAGGASISRYDSGGAFENAGTIVTSGNAWIGAAFSNSGAIQIADGTELTLNGTTVLTQNASVKGAGTLVVSGTLTADTAQTFQNLALRSGTLTGTGDVTVTGRLSSSYGTMRGTGRTIVARDATVGGEGDYEALYLGRELELAGRLDLGANESITLGVYDNASQSTIAGKLVVTAEGRVTMADGANITAYGGTNGTFENAGTIVTSGKARIDANFTNGGAIQIAEGAELTLGGTTVLTPSASVTGAGTLVVSGTLVADTAQTFQNLALRYGTLTGKGDVTVTGRLSGYAGTMTGSGRTIIARDATFGGDGYQYLYVGRELDVLGRLDLGTSQTIALGAYDGASQSYIAGKLVVTAEGRVTMADGASITDFSQSKGTFENAGTIVTSGNARIQAAFTNGGAIQIAEGTELTLDGTTVLTPASSVTGPGTLVASGTLVADTAQTFQNLALRSGTLTGKGDITVTGRLSSQYGTMMGAGRTIVAKDATFGGDSYQYLYMGRELVLAGRLELAAGQAVVLGTYDYDSQSTIAGKLVVTTEGRITMAEGASISRYGDGSTFESAGTIVTSGNARIDAPFNNGGAIQIAEGTELTLGGTTVLAPTSSVTGPGTLTVSGTLIADTAQTFQNLSLRSGTLTGNGDVTVTGRLSSYSGTMRGSGRTIIARDATFGGEDYQYLYVARELDVSGRLDLGANQTITLGSYDYQSQSYIAGKLVVAAEGRITMAEGASISRYGDGSTFENAGTIVTSGNARIDAPFNNGGAIGIAQGTELVLSGTTVLGPTSSVTGPGTLTVSGTLIADTAQTFQNLSLQSGRLTGNGDITVTGRLSSYYATMSGSGRTIVTKDATVDGIEGYSYHLFTLGRELDLAGRLSLDTYESIALGIYDTAAQSVVTGKLVVTGEGRIDLANYASIYSPYEGLGSLQNGGTLSASGETQIDADFRNTGTLAVASGTLRLYGRYANEGTVTVAPEAALDTSRLA